MFTTSLNRPHSTRKRLLSHVYSKSYIHSSQAISDITKAVISERFLPLLQQSASQPMDVYQLLNAASLDMVTGFIFGLRCSTNNLQDPAWNARWLEVYISRNVFNFYQHELPRLTALLRAVGVRLVPRWVDAAAATAETEAWTLGLCDAAERIVREDKPAARPGDVPTVYAKLRTALNQDVEKPAERLAPEAPLRLEIASELHDQYGTHLSPVPLSPSPFYPRLF